jgi:polysaccharide biosynthesis protein PslG
MRRRRRRFLSLFPLALVLTATTASAGNNTPPGLSPPVNLAPPTISGTAVQGNTLTGSNGSWGGPTPTYSTRWNRCDTAGANCVALSATGSTYALTAADVGSRMRFTVVATNKNGSTTSTSAPTAVVAPPPASSSPPPPPPPPPPPLPSPPANTALPTISGTTVAGNTLTASTGTWSGSPTSYTYAWRRCDSAGANCATISGATASTYALTSSDVNFTERVVVTATNSAGSASATSAQTAVVQAAPAPAPAPTTSSPSRFGVTVGWQLPWLSSTDRNAYLDSAKAMGVKILRFDIDWGAIQSGGSTSYNWAPQDAVVQGLNARGIATLGTIAYTPAWARPSTCNTTDKCAPASASTYGAFCGAAAKHYLPMGVHYWEVWNEPNLTAFFQPKADVVKYTAMLKACYTQIKAVDPSSIVITGGTSPAGSYNSPCGSSACTNVNGINWLEGIYANGGKGYFDGVGHHPYCFPYDPSYVAGWSAWYQMFGTTPSLRSVMVANGDGDKKIWGTEWGAPTNGPAGSGYVSESTQAAEVTSAYTLWKSYPWAGPLFTYEFRDNGTSTTSRENFFGLVRYDLSQKPSYAAYKSAVAAG